MDFGYARISTNEQNFNLQMDALLKEGIDEENIFFDKVSGSRADREKLNELLQILRKGDTLYVWKIDRMARSLIHFTKIVNDFKEKGILFKSLTEPFLDTTEESPQGKFLMNIFASLAEFERDLIKERTIAGLNAAKNRGIILGPPRGLSKEAQKTAILAEQFHNDRKPVKEILRELKISRGTYYKYLRYREDKSKENDYRYG